MIEVDINFMVQMEKKTWDYLVLHYEVADETLQHIVRLVFTWNFKM